MNLKTIQDTDVRKKRVIVRCDFNVPLKNSKILDDTKIKANLPTIQYLINHQAKTILISHLGDPKGKVIPALSLKPVLLHLKKLLGRPVFLAGDCLSAETCRTVEMMKPGDVILLENIRFFPGEEKNNLNFAKNLARLGDLFINDAFASSHRKHASTYSIAKYLKSVAGLRLSSEVSNLERIFKNPRHPFVVIMGGAKIKDKIEVISNLLPHLDYLLLGGGIANTFFASLGYGVCKSLIDSEKISLAAKLFKKYKKKIILPLDLVVAEKLKENTKTIIEDTSSFPHNICQSPHTIADIGPKTIEKFSQIIKKAKTLLWNGPLGVYEIPNFAYGTKKIGKVFSKVASGKAYGLVGGGDIVAALERLNLIKGIDYISTGGGAMLEFLAGKKLPGLEIVKK